MRKYLKPTRFMHAWSKARAMNAKKANELTAEHFLAKLTEALDHETQENVGTHYYDMSPRMSLREAFLHKKWDIFGKEMQRFADALQREMNRPRFTGAPVSDPTVEDIAAALGDEFELRDVRKAFEEAEAQGLFEEDADGRVVMTNLGTSLIAGSSGGVTDKRVREEKERRRRAELDASAS